MPTWIYLNISIVLICLTCAYELRTWIRVKSNYSSLCKQNGLCMLKATISYVVRLLGRYFPLCATQKSFHYRCDMTYVGDALFT